MSAPVSIQSPTQPVSGAKSFNDLSKAIGPIEWYWKDWLPAGFLTMIVGASGSGKSSAAMRIAACIINGLPWPDGTLPTSTPGLVLWCEAEAAQSINLQRATRLGIDLSRILVPLEDMLQDVSLNSSQHQQAIKAKANLPDVQLVIVDSLSGANRCDENTPAMLLVTKFLAELARDCNVAVLLTHHLRKKGIGDSPTVDLDRVRGSSSIVQVPRVVWAIDRPSSTSPYQRIRVIKSNIAPIPPALSIRVDEHGVEFAAVSELPKARSQIEQAVEYLTGALKEKPMNVKTIEYEALQHGIGKRTLNSAKASLRIESSRVGGRNGQWQWSLPA